MKHHWIIWAWIAVVVARSGTPSVQRWDAELGLMGIYPPWARRGGYVSGYGLIRETRYNQRVDTSRLINSVARRLRYRRRSALACEGDEVKATIASRGQSKALCISGHVPGCDQLLLDQGLISSGSANLAAGVPPRKSLEQRRTTTRVVWSKDTSFATVSRAIATLKPLRAESGDPASAPRAIIVPDRGQYLSPAMCIPRHQIRCSPRADCRVWDDGGPIRLCCPFAAVPTSGVLLVARPVGAAEDRRRWWSENRLHFPTRARGVTSRRGSMPINAREPALCPPERGWTSADERPDAIWAGFGTGIVPAPAQ